MDTCYYEWDPKGDLVDRFIDTMTIHLSRKYEPPPAYILKSKWDFCTIPGVVGWRLNDPYQITITKARLFSWKEMRASVLSFLSHAMDCHMIHTDFKPEE